MFNARFVRITATHSQSGFRVTLNYKLATDTNQTHRIVQYHEYLDVAILDAYARWLATRTMYNEWDAQGESPRQTSISDIIGDA